MTIFKTSYLTIRVRSPSKSTSLSKELFPIAPTSAMNEIWFGRATCVPLIHTKSISVLKGKKIHFRWTTYNIWQHSSYQHRDLYSRLQHLPGISSFFYLLFLLSIQASWYSPEPSHASSLPIKRCHEFTSYFQSLWYTVIPTEMCSIKLSFNLYLLKYECSKSNQWFRANFNRIWIQKIDEQDL